MKMAGGEPTSPSYMPFHVIAPVVVCLVLFSLFLVLIVFSLWQRRHYKKKKNLQQRIILKKQEEQERCLQLQAKEPQPSLPPRASVDLLMKQHEDLRRRASEGEDRFKQVESIGVSGEEGRSVAQIHTYPRTFVKERSNTPMIPPTTEAPPVPSRKGRRDISTSKERDDQRNTFTDNSSSTQPHTMEYEPTSDDEEEGAFEGPYWRFSSRKPPGKKLKVFQV